MSDWRVLIPFDRREGVGLKEAAKRAGKSEATVRTWCAQHGVGRRVGGGNWVISQVALAMFLDDARDALAAYHNGERRSDIVAAYYRRCGLADLLERPEFGCGNIFFNRVGPS
jgi:hypothetical protein